MNKPPTAAHSMGFPSRGVANGGGVVCIYSPILKAKLSPKNLAISLFHLFLILFNTF
jgi:hypothetical protein